MVAKIRIGLLLALLLVSPSFAQNLGHYTVVQELFKEQEFKKANALLIQESPDSPNAKDSEWNLLVGISHLKLRQKLAAESYLVLAAHDPHFLMQDFATLLLAESRLHQPEAAAQTFEYFTEHFPESAFMGRATLEWAKAELRQGKFRAAQKRLIELSQTDQTPLIGAPVRWHLAQLSLQRKKYRDAYRYLKELVALYPDHRLTIEASRKLERLAQLPIIRRGTRRELNQDEWYFESARVLGGKGKYELAQRRLQLLLEQYPNSDYSASARFYLGYYAELAENSAQATQQYESVIHNHPQSRYAHEALFRLGHALYQEGHFKESAEMFGRARTELPLHLSSDRNFYWEAKSFEKADNTRRAQELYRSLFERFPLTYYGYRSKLKLTGSYTSPNSLPPSPDVAIKSSSTLEATASLIMDHTQRLAFLKDWNLLESAVEEEHDWLAKAPTSTLESETELHDLLKELGYLRTAIQFAEKKIDEALVNGTLEPLPRRLWEISYPKGYWKEILHAAAKFEIDPFLVLAVIREESRFNQRAVSRSRAIGLMQIVPRTGRAIAKRLGLGYYRTAHLFIPKVNITMGTYYLARLLKAYENEALALAAYNGGPVRVDRWSKKMNSGSELDIDEFVEQIPVRETRNYVKKVMRSYFEYRQAYDTGGGS